MTPKLSNDILNKLVSPIKPGRPEMGKDTGEKAAWELKEQCQRTL